MTGGCAPASETAEWIEVVVKENADDILRYLRRRVNQPEDAADLLGRVLLALWENATRVPATDPESRMWCFGIARNVLREYYRHTAKRIALADDLREHLRSAAQPDNAADAAAEVRMRAEVVRRAVMSLDARSRELVTLIHWDGFTIAEAARLLSMNESTARTRYGRALQRLQRGL
ncbi:RNA polymerase sigma factor [Microbacterium sp. AGC62]|uniref:RNA polymerase sigma factor n=1 Tax=Microbacterium sp. NPDC087592 TaxID=3364193 RepID=UPI00380EA27C